MCMLTYLVISPACYCTLNMALGSWLRAGFSVGEDLLGRQLSQATI